jgi:hypothetical protein
MWSSTIVLTVCLLTSGQESGRAGGARAKTLRESQASAPRTASTAERWVPLFNGRNLDGWYTFLQKHGKNQDPDHVIAIEDGAIHLYKDAPESSNVVMG